MESNENLVCLACGEELFESALPRIICEFCGSVYNNNLSRLRGGSDRERVRLPSVDHQRDGPLRTFGAYLAHKFNFTPRDGQLTSYMLRPSSDTSLPAIAKDSRGKLVTITTPCLDERARTTKSESELRLFLSDSSDPNKIEYPNRKISREEFLEQIEEAKTQKRYTTIKGFYSTTYDSFQEINAVFKNEPDKDEVKLNDPDLKNLLLKAINEAIIDMPQHVHKALLKSMINALMQKDKSKDNIRAFYILIQNSIFGWQYSYPVLGHVLRQICTLASADHHLLMYWINNMDDEAMKNIIKYLHQFVAVAHFTPASEINSSQVPRKWWISCATKVLALLNAANNLSTPNKILYTEFYNCALDHADLMTEYHYWQNPDRPDRFSYCQYPFVLSIVAKRTILQKDSEQQMVWNARVKKLSGNCNSKRNAQSRYFFLNIQIKRSHLVLDSLHEIAKKQKDLKKKLKVTFEGEPGLDMGGLTKEWFLLLIRKLFDQDQGMFVYHAEARCYWFSLTAKGNLREYNLIGVLMGLAVYNSITLDVRFPFVCYKKLLSPPVVPSSESAPVGICKNASPTDLAEIMPEVGRSLNEVLKYEGDVEDMDLTYLASVEEFGKKMDWPLKPGGDNITVTNENRADFVESYVNWVINQGIYDKFKAFYLGFHSVCASNALIMLRPEEVEILVCGSPKLDMVELRKVTIYENCSPNDTYIQDFWEVVNSFSLDEHKKFLLFTTGSDRVPVGGMGEMIFKISCTRERSNMLPTSHTCFNQLVLPLYPNKEILRNKLIIAINNAEGFGLE
uniref:HECT-type E3 ubiquitin transferase n=1 Tax=Strigamia maritima TaxID=126957 RepID=T1J0Y5_STRMM